MSDMAQLLSLCTPDAAVFHHLAWGPGRFLGKKNGLVQSVHACAKNSRKITVKSLVYVEMKYTAKVFGTRLLLHVYTSVHG